MRLPSEAGETPEGTAVTVRDVRYILDAEYEEYSRMHGTIRGWDGQYYTVLLQELLDDDHRERGSERNFYPQELDLGACEGVLATRRETANAN